MAELDYFPFRYRYAKKIEKLSDQEVGRLVRALLKYGATGERQELTGRESIAFDFIADDIDEAKEAYESKCKQMQANGSKSIQKGANGSKSTKKGANADNTIQYNTIQYNSVCDSIPSNPAPAREDTHTPSTPTEAEIAAYCAENGISIDVKRFFCTYASNGWKDVHGNAVTDWRSKVILWANGDKEKRKAASDVACSTFDTDEFLNLAMKKTF